MKTEVKGALASALPAVNMGGGRSERPDRRPVRGANRAGLFD